MKKKTSRKLSLTAATLRVLSTSELPAALGGMTSLTAVTRMCTTTDIKTSITICKMV